MVTAFSEHGVFVVLHHTGVMLRGPAGIGKSTLALELIERGHQLLSDDIIDFRYDNKSRKLIASCPPMLQGLLAVRDLGILNITDLFHHDRLVTESPLQLIIDLADADEFADNNPFLPYANRDFNGHSIPQLRLYAHPKRNMAVIVETAVKNYILCKSGNDAGQLLAQRQQQYL